MKKKLLDGLIVKQNLIGKSVFSIEDGQNIGTVKDVLVEKGTKQPIFLVADEEWFKGGKVIRGSHVSKIGKDALVVENKEKLMTVNNPEVEDIMSKSICFRGKAVTKDNQQLGEIKEYSIDCNKIECIDLEVVTEPETDKRSYFPVEDITDITEDGVVLKESPPAPVVEESPEIKDQEQNGQSTEKNGEDSGLVPTAESQEGLIEESADTSAIGAHKDLKQILEERQDKFLLGKKADRDITADDGTLIIQKGEVITKEILEEAKKAHKYIVLSFCIKTDLVKKS